MENIKREIIQHALHVLTVQLVHCANDHNGKQRAYYEGMRTMLEMIISNNYAENNFVIGRNGGHGVLLASGEIIREK